MNRKQLIDRIKESKYHSFSYFYSIRNVCGMKQLVFFMNASVTLKNQDNCYKNDNTSVLYSRSLLYNMSKVKYNRTLGNTAPTCSKHSRANSTSLILSGWRNTANFLYLSIEQYTC